MLRNKLFSVIVRNFIFPISELICCLRRTIAQIVKKRFLREFTCPMQLRETVFFPSSLRLLNFKFFVFFFLESAYHPSLFQAYILIDYFDSYWFSLWVHTVLDYVDLSWGRCGVVWFWLVVRPQLTGLTRLEWVTLQSSEFPHLTVWVESATAAGNLRAIKSDKTPRVV